MITQSTRWPGAVPSPRRDRRGAPHGDGGRPPRWTHWALVGALATFGACGGEPEGPAEPATPQSTAQPQPVDTPAQAPPPGGPLLPRFEGERADGEGRVSTDLLQDQRALIFSFASGDAAAEVAGRIVQGLQRDAEEANIALLGVSRDGDSESARSFAEEYGLDFPVLLDSDGSISQQLRVRAGFPAFTLVDQKGYVLGTAPIQDPESAPFLENQIREALHLPGAEQKSLQLGFRREAPEFEVSQIGGGSLQLSDLRGQVAVVMFFLHTCPHCHEALQFLNRLRGELPEEDFAVVPISVRTNEAAVQRMAEELDVDFTFYTDPGRAAQRLYTGTGSVPNIYVIDAEGRVISQREGMDARIEALLTMQIRHELGAENPILLARDAFSGSETCSVCHTEQHETWSLTTHAHAYETLVQRGQERNAECIGCHSVGFGEPGGYSLEAQQPQLQGVQCENCHGRGGPHQSPEFAAQGFESVCLGCHTPEHSLRFRFAERLPMVSHAANRERVASLSFEERIALLQERDKRERQLFEPAEFVGSETCQGCHESEHEIWSESAHATAFETLRASDQHTDETCQTCHTTGFGMDGGFPTGGETFEGVGCESCHGPGGQHAPADAPKSGTILALADKCDSCVILQICGSCHDEQNDPGFEFAVERKIDRIRHATPPGGGEPSGSSAE